MAITSRTDKLEWLAAADCRLLHHRACDRHDKGVYALAPNADQSASLSCCECYATFGGLVDSDTLLARLREHTTQPISRLARWIVAGEVLQLQGQESYFPLFQFRPTDMTLRPEVRSVVAELRGVIDDAALAIWFAHPHTLLGNRHPAAVLHEQPAAVVAAARAERFAIKG